MGREHRREPRVRTSFNVELETAGRITRFETRNASFSGLFLVTDDTLPLRRLVRIRAEVSGEVLELIGLVAHTVNPADAVELNKQPGMGISLFSLGHRQRDVWNEFVRTEYEGDPDAHAALIASELPRLNVALKNEKMKEQFFGSDLPSGEIFYRTPDLMPEGTLVVVEVRHPDTGKTLELFAHVVEVVEGSRRKRGIRIAFDEMSEASSNRLVRFESGQSSEAESEG